MEANKIELTFKCPVKWNSMSDSRDGKYCSSCKKVVKDFTNSKVDEVKCVSSEFECGSFYATQLHKPFNDKRDVLISYYQNLVAKRSPRKMALFFVAMLLFVTGCRSRRMGGAYAFAPEEKKAQSTEIHPTTNKNVPN